MIAFSNSYARLPAHFFARLGPTPVSRPRLIRCNRALADELGIDLTGLDDSALAAVFSGNAVPPGAEPLAQAYAGHQFGQFVPQLGDGRALLLGEVLDRHGQRRDLQLKGSGRTPWSRGGDGRAALGPVLREYLVSEAMHALGIPSTRALAAVSSGDYVYREERLPGAVLTRVAASHVRVGSFEYFAARADHAAVRQLADYVIERHFPGLAAAGNPWLALLAAVCERQARLVAQWLSVGFIHGVMNTDNMAISGETIDFGPCAFMDAYDPATVYSSIDGHGRYAYDNQPHAAQWNLARFAETLLPLIDADGERALALASAEIHAFPDRYADHWLALMRAKLGLAGAQDGDLELVQSLLALMQADAVDYTLAFRQLCAAAEDPLADGADIGLFRDRPALAAWLARWRARLAHEALPAARRAEAMRAANPGVIPRNHRIEQVIAAAVAGADFAPFDELLAAITQPYADDGRYAAYRAPPLADERVLHTFCGT